MNQAINIVLHQPEIPHNTGAIGRTCLMTGARLHLIRPLGFYLDEKSLKRSGLDYWPKIDVSIYDNFEDFIQNQDASQFQTKSLYLAESNKGIIYTNVTYNPGDYIIFGSETTGLPASILDKYPSQIINIPMKGEDRSLNLSVAAGIVLYEALRQNNFPSLI